jgi:hypothetical protein
VDALTALGSRIRAARNELARDQRLSTGDLGFPEVVDAVDDFEGSWRKRRTELTQSLDDAHGLLTDVVVDFTAADSGLARGLGGGR